MEGEYMKRLIGVLILLVALVALIPATVSADMTWEEFCEEYGEFPPPPPDATNTDVWVDPFNEAPRVQGDYSDGGESVASMNAEAFLDSVDWAGQDVWLWS
jgi:hypothetical protein